MKLVLSLFISVVLFNLSSVFAQQTFIDHVKDFQIEKFEGKELTVGFTTSLDFLSTRTAAVKLKKGKLFKNGEYYGYFELLDKIKISKKVNKNIKVRLKVTLEKEINLLEEGLKAFMGNPLELKMTGVFRGSRFVFWKNYPFEFQEKVSLKNIINK